MRGSFSPHSHSPCCSPPHSYSPSSPLLSSQTSSPPPPHSSRSSSHEMRGCCPSHSQTSSPSLRSLHQKRGRSPPHFLCSSSPHPASSSSPRAPWSAWTSSFSCTGLSAPSYKSSASWASALFYSLLPPLPQPQPPSQPPPLHPHPLQSGPKTYCSVSIRSPSSLEQP